MRGLSHRCAYDRPLADVSCEQTMCAMDSMLLDKGMDKGMDKGIAIPLKSVLVANWSAAAASLIPFPSQHGLSGSPAN